MTLKTLFLVGAFLITWNRPPAEQGIESFNVFRFTRAAPDTVLIQTVSDTFCIDQDIIPGVRYFYAIQAVSARGVSNLSDTVSAAEMEFPGIYGAEGQIIMKRRGSISSVDLLRVQCQGIPARITWDAWGNMEERIIIECSWDNWGTPGVLDLSDFSAEGERLWTDDRARAAFMKYYGKKTTYEGKVH